ncbi:hypothetical protein AA313_de0203883 [Arthrobotrys entomopaga]|nr:hypothetical protein AA313_de0203883 [Arthrobotrys entomopaga]
MGVKLFSQNNCIFAIRSGGHMPNPGFSSTGDGILISLSGLKEITYTSSSGGDVGVVRIGSGNRWADVYAELDPLDITVMGGRSEDVGVGGFLLGGRYLPLLQTYDTCPTFFISRLYIRLLGGFSYLSNANGWSADNVVDFEIVLANGTIAHANAQQNIDLFQSLKGGSSNFGVVTTFTTRAFAVSNITAGVVLYEASSIPQLLGAAYQYTSAGADADPKSHVIPAWVKIGILPVIPSFTVFYSEQFDTPPPIVKPFIDGSIPYFLNTVSKQKGISGIAKRLGLGQPSGLRNRWQDISAVADASLFEEIFKIWTTEAKPYETIIGFANNLSIQPIGRKFIRAGISNGGNSMGITTPIVSISVNIVWVSPTDDVKVIAYLDTLFAKFKEATIAAGKDSPFEYMNYAGPKQNPISNYGADNIAQLRVTKQKYDPTDVFGNLVKGGFKIPGV